MKPFATATRINAPLTEAIWRCVCWLCLSDIQIIHKQFSSAKLPFQNRPARLIFVARCNHCQREHSKSAVRILNIRESSERTSQHFMAVMPRTSNGVNLWNERSGCRKREGMGGAGDFRGMERCMGGDLTRWKQHVNTPSNAQQYVPSIRSR